MRTLFNLFVLFVLVSVGFLGGCDSSPRQHLDLDEVAEEGQLLEESYKTTENTFNFGFDLRGSVKEDVRQYAPLLKYLGQATGYRFKIRFTPKISQIEDDLGEGVVHFAAIGAGTYLAARQRYGVIPLVRGINMEGEAEYQAAIVVHPQSTIQSIDDLRGKSFAFGSFTSTQGHLIPRGILAQHGLTLEDLSRYSWTGSHYNCASAVSSGEFSACGMQDTMALSLAKAGQIKILLLSDHYPSSGIAANKDVDPQVLDRVKKALLDFEPQGRHATGLYHWEKTEMPNGFVEAHPRDYDALIIWAEKFGLQKDTL